jgi:tetratricopeptide (TPR) repeat protein
MHRASAHCKQRQCEEAISLLEEANRIAPANPAIYFHLGLCHSGGCTQHSLVDRAMAAAYLRRALLLAEAGADVLLRARILNALGNVYSHSGADAAQLRQAIEYHSEAAEIYARLSQRDEWAREEFNQAGAWCELPEAQFPDKWERGIEHYEKALTVRTQSYDPQAYASTMLNLGTALRQLPAGEKRQNVLKAIGCYRQASRVYKCKTLPKQFAELSNNLGTACMSYPSQNEAGAARHARHARRHFKQALEIWNCAEYGCYYALAQYNLGCAHLKLPSSSRCLEAAIRCFVAAVDCAKSCGQAEVERLASAQLKGLVAGMTKTDSTCPAPVAQCKGGEQCQ